jgi:hypothetical protein
VVDELARNAALFKTCTTDSDCTAGATCVTADATCRVSEALLMHQHVARVQASSTRPHPFTQAHLFTNGLQIRTCVNGVLASTACTKICKVATAVFGSAPPKLTADSRISVALNQVPAPMSVPCARIFDAATATKLGQSKCSTDGSAAVLTITPIGSVSLALSEYAWRLVRMPEALLLLLLCMAPSRNSCSLITRDPGMHCCALAANTLVLAAGQTELKTANGGTAFTGTSGGLVTCANAESCPAPVAVLKVRPERCAGPADPPHNFGSISDCIPDLQLFG